MIIKKQKTIAGEVKLSGIGLHSGEKCEVTLKPSIAYSGIVIKRMDLPEQPEVKLSSGTFVNKGRRTVMKADDLKDSFEVETTEHLCSALKGLDIDNVIIEINNAELPGLDGSAKEQSDAILKVGVKELEEQRVVYFLNDEISIATDKASITAEPYQKGLKISYTLDYSAVGLPTQFFSIELTPEGFLKEIAPSRTFCMRAEAEALQAAGFGKGANTKNTLVIENGLPIENKFRFENELARHKVLDLIGDLSLLGFDMNMHIIAKKSGHIENNLLIKKLRNLMKDQATAIGPLTFEQIKSLIPHRYPFLLVDKIIEMNDKKVVGIKNVTGNEPYFTGHFSFQAVMPGVLQVEAMAQVAGLIFRIKNRDPDIIPLLLTVDKVKWRKAVVPGDQLRIEVDILSMKPENIPTKGKVYASCFVGEDKVSEAEIKFILAKR